MNLDHNREKSLSVLKESPIATPFHHSIIPSYQEGTQLGTWRERVASYVSAWLMVGERGFMKIQDISMLGGICLVLIIIRGPRGKKHKKKPLSHLFLPGPFSFYTGKLEI